MTPDTILGLLTLASAAILYLGAAVEQWLRERRDHKRQQRREWAADAISRAETEGRIVNP